MSDELLTLLYEVLGGFVRAGLAALSAWLIKQHIITAPQGDRLTTELAAYIMLAVPFVAAVVWSTWAKSRMRQKLETALNAAKLTEDDVRQKIKIGQGVKLFALLLVVLAWPASTYAQVPACSTTAAGHERWKLKTRKAPDHYVVAGHLTAADVIGWAVPNVARSDEVVDAKHEAQIWELTAYVRLAKLSADDCDIHLQLADKATGNGPEVIVEIPSNESAARKAIAGILGGIHEGPHTYSGAEAHKISVIGYGFIDQEHATKDGNKRGHAHGTSEVATIYELHPVFEVKEVQ